MSLIGKVNVINTLVASLFVYKMMVLPKILEAIVSRIENIMRQFIWDKKRPKISLKMLQKVKEHGGLKLVSLAHSDAALKVTWIQILKQEKKLSEIVYQKMCLELKEDIWKTNLNAHDAKKLISKGFWLDVLIAWIWFRESNENLEESTFIWYNSKIKIGGKPILWKKCYKKGLKYVEQLFEAGEWKSFHELHESYGITFLKLSGLMSAIPQELVNKCKERKDGPLTPYDRMIGKGDFAKEVYKVLVQDTYAIDKKG